LIKEVQGAQQDEPSPLDGKMPEGSPEQRKRKALREAAKKGAQTKAAQKEEKAIRVTDAINAAKMPPEPKPEAKLTWKIHHMQSGRTQNETAVIMSHRLGYPVNQQWVSDRLRDCKRWVEKTGLSVDDIEDLPGGKERRMPPAAIDMGPRWDSQPSAQQQKSQQIREGSDDAGWNQTAERMKPDDSFDGSGYGPASTK
jgi:hypothetical protein